MSYLVLLVFIANVFQKEFSVDQSVLYPTQRRGKTHVFHSLHCIIDFILGGPLFLRYIGVGSEQNRPSSNVDVAEKEETIIQAMTPDERYYYRQARRQLARAMANP